MMTREKVIEASHRHLDIWWEGYDAAIGGKSAAFCPYTPRSEDKMFAWLSGHVTAKDEMEAGDLGVDA